MNSTPKPRSTDHFAHRTSKENLEKILASGQIKSLKHIAEDSPGLKVKVEPFRTSLVRREMPAGDAVKAMSGKKDVSSIFLTRGGYTGNTNYGDYTIVKTLSSPKESPNINTIKGEHITGRRLSVRSNADVYVPDKEVEEWKGKFPEYSFKPHSEIPVKRYPRHSALNLAEKTKKRYMNKRANIQIGGGGFEVGGKGVTIPSGQRRRRLDIQDVRKPRKFPKRTAVLGGSGLLLAGGIAAMTRKEASTLKRKASLLGAYGLTAASAGALPSYKKGKKQGASKGYASGYQDGVRDRLELTQNKTASLTMSQLRQLSPNARLTGSTALGLNTPGSDIDVFIPYKTKQHYERAKDRLIEKYDLTPSPYNARRKDAFVLTGEIDGSEVDVALGYGERAWERQRSIDAANAVLTDKDRERIRKKKERLQRTWFMRNKRYGSYKKRLDNSLGIVRL